MELKLIREVINDVCTIGKLYIDGKAFCNTLEDVVREDGEFIEEETAIPAGTYTIKIDCLEGFNTHMPILQEVPGFSDVAIQWGTTNKDVNGDIIVGFWDRKTLNTIDNSKYTYKQLLSKIIAANGKGETITITIQNGRD